MDALRFFLVKTGAYNGPLVLIIGYTMFFVPTPEHDNGLLNAAAYPRYAFFCAILIITAVLVSTWSTRKYIPYLPKASQSQTASLSSILLGLKRALRLGSYRSIVGYTMMLYIGIGIGTTLTTYFMTFYFDLDA